MQLVTDLVELRELILTVRQFSEELTTNRLQAYLPNRPVEDIDYRVVQAQRQNRAARIRAFDTPARLGVRPGLKERRGSLPPISEILPLSESERHRIRRLVGNVGDLIRNNVFNDAANLAQAVANRLELLRGEALSTGQIVIDEGGVDQAVDYEIPAELQVAPATAWNSTNVDGEYDADIIGDLTTWLEAYNDHGNDGVGVILTSTRVRSFLLRNVAVRHLVYGRNADSATIVGQNALNDVLGVHGLPPIAVYDRKVEDADGNLGRVIAENKLLFLPGTGDAARRLGETQMGVTEEAVTLTESNVIAADEAPGIVAVTLRNDEPVYTATKVAAIGLPVIQDNERVLIADVF